MKMMIQAMAEFPGTLRARLIPDQDATHFFFRYQLNKSVAPATEADIGGLPLNSLN